MDDEQRMDERYADDEGEARMSEPGAPHQPNPLRIGGFVLLGVAAVAAVVGLVSAAGGGGDGSAAPPIAAASSAPVPPPAPPPPPPAVSVPAPVPTAPPVVPVPGNPQAAAPTPAPVQPPTPPADGTGPGTGQLPGAGLPPTGSWSGSGSDDSTGSRRGGTAAKAPVRVYNNSTVRDLAQHAAADFRSSGWKVTEVGNYPYGSISTSTVYFRPGTGEQAAAESLARGFGLHAAPRFPGIAGASPGLIVIVTQDFQRR